MLSTPLIDRITDTAHVVHDGEYRLILDGHHRLVVRLNIMYFMAPGRLRRLSAVDFLEALIQQVQARLSAQPSDPTRVNTEQLSTAFHASLRDILPRVAHLRGGTVLKLDQTQWDLLNALLNFRCRPGDALVPQASVRLAK